MKDTPIELSIIPYNISLLGEIGVDIFFVISGAIMTIILSRNPLTPLTFLKKRCIRILPLYWFLSLALYFYIVIIRHGAEPTLSVIKTFTIFPIFDQNIKGLIYFVGIGNYPLLAAGWTLSFEFLFYSVVAIGLYFNRKNAIFFACILLVAMVCAGLVFRVNNLQYIFVTDPFMIEFVLGAICGWLYLSKIKTSNAVCYCLLSAFFLIVLLNIIFTVKYGVDSVLYTSNALRQLLNYGTASFFLVSSLLLLEKNKALKINRLFIWLGDISYATYLVHLPLQAILIKYYLKLNFSNTYLFVVVGIIYPILIGYIVHVFIEKPLASLFKRFGRSRKIILETA